MSREEKLKVMHTVWQNLARKEDTTESPPCHGNAQRETQERVRSGVERVLERQEAKPELRRWAG
jgi:hypothetical protein